MRKGCFLLGACGVCALAAATALADEHRSVKLDYLRLPGTEQCPSGEVFAADVASYLGYDPFSTAARVLLRVRVEPAPRQGLTASIELVGPDGTLAGRQVLSSGSPDCRQLAESLSLTAGLALDPPLQVATPGAAAAEKAAPVAEKLSPGPPLRLGMGVGAQGSVGLAPAPALGLQLEVELRRGNYSLILEGRADLDASTNLSPGPGSISAQLVTGSLVPCAHLSRRDTGLGGCVLVTAGAEQASASANLPGATHNVTPYLGLGGRVFIEFWPMDWLVLRTSIELDLPLIRTVVTVGGSDVWTTPPIGSTLALTGVMFLP